MYRLRVDEHDRRQLHLWRKRNQSVTAKHGVRGSGRFGLLHGLRYGDRADVVCLLQLVHIPALHRAAFAEVFMQAAREADPDADAATLQNAHDRAMAGPCLIAVLARLTPSHPVVPVEEQWISVGAGLQNLLLAARSLGLHTKPLSGRRLRSRALREAFRLPEHTYLAAFVVVGRYSGPPTEKPRRTASETLQVWSPG
ncbi:MAG: nitroreductase family protein [Rhodobacteraceae bacterium]|nr:nitroreductase family protein [Paracoccaceae bacterium]